MRPALEYASSIRSPFASSTSMNKLQVLQKTALRTATGCTQDTNIPHLHYEKHSHFPHSSTCHNTNRKQNFHHISYTNIQHTSTLKGQKHDLQQWPLYNKHSHRPPHRHKNKHAKEWVDNNQPHLLLMRKPSINETTTGHYITHFFLVIANF